MDRSHCRPDALPSTYPPVPQVILDKWQSAVDTLTDLLNIPTVLVTRMTLSEIEVLRTCSSAENPFRNGDRIEITGLYCEHVIKTKTKLTIPDATADPRWADSPGARAGMTSYLGLPLLWPDGEVFGTLCAMTNKPEQFTDVLDRSIGLFREAIEGHLGLIYAEHSKDQALEAARVYYRKLFENANEAIVIMDQGCFIECNPLALELFGCTREQFIAQNPYDRFSPELQPDGRLSKEKALERINAAMAGRPQRFEWTHVRYDGTEFETEISLNRLDLPDGPRLQALIQDITARKISQRKEAQHREQLVHADRLSTVGRMAAELVHELSQPITAISNASRVNLRWLDKVPKDIEGIPQLTNATELIASQSERTVEILNRIKGFVRKDKSHRIATNLNKLVEKALQFSESDIRQHQTQVDLRLSKLPPTPTDPIQIEQILVNLIRNALEAMEELPTSRRHLTIRTHPSDSEHNEIAVSDTGPGLTNEQAGHLFEPFYTTKSEGLGIGLPICLSIAHDHHGELTVESAPNNGSTFRLTLPLNGT